MWTMHEYINADRQEENRDFGYEEMEGDEVIVFITNAVKGNSKIKVYRNEYGDIKLVEDLGNKRHCWKFTHHIPLTEFDDIPYEVVRGE